MRIEEKSKECRNVYRFQSYRKMLSPLKNRNAGKKKVGKLKRLGSGEGMTEVRGEDR